MRSYTPRIVGHGSPTRSSNRTSMIRSSGSVPSARQLHHESIAIAVPCTALFTTASTSTVSLCIQRSVAMMLTSDGSTLQRVAVRQDHVRVGVLGEERGQLREVRRRLQHPPLARAAPLEQLQESPVRAEHGREVGPRQPARRSSAPGTSP